MCHLEQLRYAMFCCNVMRDPIGTSRDRFANIMLVLYYIVSYIFFYNPWSHIHRMFPTNCVISCCHPNQTNIRFYQFSCQQYLLSFKDSNELLLRVIKMFGRYPASESLIDQQFCLCFVFEFEMFGLVNWHFVTTLWKASSFMTFIGQNVTGRSGLTKIWPTPVI